MLSKLLMGVSAAMGLALAIVFWLLLGAKEANGKLQEGISTAAGINNRQALAIEAVQASNDRLLADIEAERVRTRAATVAMEAARSSLADEKRSFNERLDAAVAGMNDEELVCANESVPAAFIISLHDSTSGIE